MILNKLIKMRDILLQVTDSTYHYEALKKTDSYIVWAESGEGDSVHIDDVKDQQVIQGTIDYFTKAEYDSNIDLIQSTLNQNKISYILNSVQYEEETKYIHYEWIWEF